MRVAIYLRVSTEEQTVENQLPVLLSQCHSRGWDIVKIYQEGESAWSAGHQQEFAKLLKSASYHEFDILLVWALDRISRQGITVLISMVDVLKSYKIQIVSHEEPWTEMPNEMTPLFYAFAAWAAKYESDRKSARIKAALDRRKAKGLPVGRIIGAKDKQPRKRSGYLRRYADRRM
jgi:putative DNA-invertase from lambdoid prophage Rac